MLKDIVSYVGSKYIDTLGCDFLELTDLISEDIKECIKNGELPDGYYSVDAFESIAGYSIKVDGNIYSDLDHSEEHVYREKIEDLVGKYNYYRADPPHDERDRRFYNENIELW